MPVDIFEHFGKRNKPFLHGGGVRATDQLISIIEFKGFEQVLEIGCGTGATQVRLKSKFPYLDLIGVDTSATMLRKVKNRLHWAFLNSDKLYLIPEIDFSLPFSNDAFDIVFFESVINIHSIQDIKKMLMEITRVLKPGGVLAFNETMWLPEIPRDEITNINKKCLDEFGIIQAQADLATIDDWTLFLTNEGFKVISCDKILPKSFKPKYRIRDFLSASYSYLGEIIAFFNLNNNMIRKQLNRLRVTDPGSRIQYLEGYIVKLVKK